MSNIASDKVKVFPFGSTRTTDPHSRVLNEHNIIKLVKSVVDKDSYVISADNKLFKFVLGGYYFECDLSQYSKVPTYASIQITTSNDGCFYLNGGDESGTFTGVNFTDEWPTENATHVLQLVDGKGNVPSASLVRFSNSAVQFPYKVINCGSSTDVL